jgi:hypothetical protein
MPERALPEVSKDPHQPELAGPAPVLQWLGMFLAPATFFVHLQAGYLLVLYVCGTTLSNALVYAANLAALVVALVGCWAAVTTWRRAGGSEPGDGVGAIPRSRMLGAVGMGMSALLTLLLFAQFVAALVAPTCE